VAGLRVQGTQRRLELVERVDPPGGLAAHAGGRLEHDRQADLGDERLGVGPRLDQLVPGARESVLAELLLHPGLVAEQVGGLGGRPRDAEGLADLAELDLERLENPEQAVDLAVPALEDLGRLAQLAGIEAVLDLDHVSE